MAKTKTLYKSNSLFRYAERWSRSYVGGQFILVKSSTKYEATYPASASVPPTDLNLAKCAWYMKRDWNTTPNWKAVKRSLGYLPTLAMSEVHRSHTTRTTNFKVKNVTDDQWHEYGAELNIPYPSLTGYSGYFWGSDSSNAAIDAQTKCLSRARDMKVNIPVLFGEGRQTVRMLTDTARTLGRAYGAFRKGNFGKAARLLGIDKPAKFASNHWLAYQYGWKPLLSDSLGLAYLAFDHLYQGERLPRITVTSKVRIPRSVNFTIASRAIGNLQGDYRVVGDTVTTARAGLRLQMNYSSSALAAQTGFGLTDPLLLAWELTPFSFVFDWFIEVGSYLENASALQGWTVLDGWTNVELEGIYYIYTKFSYLNFYVFEGSTPTADVNDRSFSRVKWMGSVPALRMHSIKDALGTDRLKTTASLWRQRLRGDRNGSYRP